MTNKKAIITGMIWGTLTGIIHTLIMSYFFDADYTSPLLLITVVIWLLAGLAFGFTMKLVQNRKNRH